MFGERVGAVRSDKFSASLYRVGTEQCSVPRLFATLRAVLRKSIKDIEEKIRSVAAPVLRISF